MSGKTEAGFTVIEVLVAVVVLALGTLMIAGGSLGITRDLVRARGATAAVGMAESKVEELRAVAVSTTTACTSSAFASSGSPTVQNGVTLSWVVPTSGTRRTIQVISRYSLGRNRTHADTLVSYITC